MRRFAAALLCLALAGCATVNGPTEPHDPLESFNRAVYQFNDGLDRAVLRPAAETYEAVVPRPINTGITNFFSNLDDVVVLANDLLQVKFRQAASDFGRITFNTTFGLAGLIDVATHMDLPKHEEDFGQTLAYWGVGSGPYLVLPFYGPSTVRDTVGLAADMQIDPVWHIDDDGARYGTVVLRTVDIRAGLLGATRIMEETALDPYIFIRESYLQRREHLIHDGNPPPPDLDGLFDDDEFLDVMQEPDLRPDATP